MAEIDLVPIDYRRSLQLRTWLRRFAGLYVALAVGIVAARALLSWELSARFRAVEELEAAERARLAQEAELSQLRRETRAARRHLSILSGLRGGISAQDMFVSMDRALDGRVWFVDWTFRRAGELVDEDPKGVQTGYFLVIPIDEESEPKRAWRMETHMEIQGRARDHSTLAGFVSRLLDEPRIGQVRIVKTQMREIAAVEVVDFELAVVVRTEA